MVGERGGKFSHAKHGYSTVRVVAAPFDKGKIDRQRRALVAHFQLFGQFQTKGRDFGLALQNRDYVLPRLSLNEHDGRKKRVRQATATTLARDKGSSTYMAENDDVLCNETKAMSV